MSARPQRERERCYSFRGTQLLVEPFWHIVCLLVSAICADKATLIRQRIRCDERGGLAPLAPQQRQTRRRRAALPIRRANCEDQFPLPEERPVGCEQRVARVVNARGFGRRAVELDDLKTAASPQIVLGRIANVIAANEKAAEPLRNGVDAALQFVGPK